jgi:hypothetical protein
LDEELIVDADDNFSFFSKQTMNVALLNPYTSDHPEVVESELDNQGVSTTVSGIRPTRQLPGVRRQRRPRASVGLRDAVSGARAVRTRAADHGAESWSRDSQRLLSASVDWTVRVWLVADAKARCVTMRCQAQIGHAYLHPRDALFLVCPLLHAGAAGRRTDRHRESNQLSMRALPLPDAVVRRWARRARAWRQCRDFHVRAAIRLSPATARAWCWCSTPSRCR